MSLCFLKIFLKLRYQLMRKNGPEGLASQCAKMGLWRSCLPHSLGPRSAVLLRTGGGRHPIEKSRSYHLTIFVITIKFNQFSFPYSYHCLYSFCHLSAFVSSQLSVNSLIYQAKEIELKDKTNTNWFVIVLCFQGQKQLQLHICINGIFCSTIVAFA